MVKIRFLKLLDALLGTIVVHAAPVPKRPLIGHYAPSRILFVRPGGIGDAVLLIPSIKAVKNRFPAAAIHILAEKRNAEVFSLTTDVERVYLYDKPLELLSAIRGSYDVVIDTEQWHRLSAVVARLARAPMTVGFATNERKKLFTHPIAYAQDDYEVDSFFHLLEPLIGKAPREGDDPFLAIPEHCLSTVKQMIRALTKKIVTIFPGGSVAERRWGSERFHEVAMRLSERGYGLVVVGGKGDFRVGEDILRDIPDSLNLCGRLSLPETAAVLQESSLLITGDSGIMHIGYGLKKRTVALFGPGREKKWAPRSSRVAILNKRLACSPCTQFGYTPKCTIDAVCMKDITAHEVIERALELLGTV